MPAFGQFPGFAVLARGSAFSRGLNVFTGCLTLVMLFGSALFMPGLAEDTSLAALSARGTGVPGREHEVGENELHSPDGAVQVTFTLTNDSAPCYRVRYRNAPVLEESRLGFLVKDGAPLTNGFRMVGFERTNHDEVWKPVAGERAEVRDHFNGLTIRLADSQVPPREVQIEFRAYNEGVAFRYRLRGASGSSVTLTDEVSEFRFAGDYPCWPVYSAQGVYARTLISGVRPNCERPLTVDLQDGRWASVGEAGLVDFARMKLQPAGRSNSLRAHLGGPVTVPLPYTAPWRFVLLADSAGGLIERNYLVSNLNAPCAIKDTSWIKPGTVIREASLTTEGGKACVDFAARMGISYVEFDAGWYGPEELDASDARAVNLDPRRSKGPLDLPEVIRYGSEKGVGVILYVNRRALEKQLDEILSLYQRWGVKGVKYGFVNVGSQRWTAWLHEAVRKAAEHQLVVDVHDEHRPTGLSRTWPNLLTQEGVRGNEEMPTAEHNLILPFTRFICGPADYTFCWNDKRSKNTRTHQLAASVVFFSPLQFLFWYDRPAQIADEPALDFWRHLPTTWDDTRVLEGKPGEYATVARRKGDSWYLGSLNGFNPRQIQVRLDFMSEGRTYEALICSDTGPDKGAKTRVQVERRNVRKGDVLRAEAGASGGLAVRLNP